MSIAIANSTPTVTPTLIPILRRVCDLLNGEVGDGDENTEDEGVGDVVIAVATRSLRGIFTILSVSVPLQHAVVAPQHQSSELLVPSQGVS